MGIKHQVFASKIERRQYYKLARQWGKNYNIYHNLPFLNVFNPQQLFDEDFRPIVLSPLELNRLKKTSIDYTLCDVNDRPILCIEFDGMNEGFNIGTEYSARNPDPWRVEITNLKLRVAHGSFFPFFIVGYKQFADLSPTVKLTLVDAIIGEVLANRAAHERISEGFDPFDRGLSQEDFDTLMPDEKQEIIQDWLIDIEVETEMEHNPISQLCWEFMKQSGVTSWSYRFLEYPPIDSNTSIEERIVLLKKVKLIGVECTVTPKIGIPLTRQVWLPNFRTPGFTGLGLLEELARLLACMTILIRTGVIPNIPGTGSLVERE